MDNLKLEQIEEVMGKYETIKMKLNENNSSEEKLELFEKVFNSTLFELLQEGWISDTLAGATKGVAKLTGAAKSARNWMLNRWDDAKEIINKAKELGKEAYKAIINFFKDLPKKVKNLAEKSWDKIINTINWIVEGLGKLKDLAKSIIDWIGSKVMELLIDPIKNLTSKIVENFKETEKEAFSEVPKKIENFKEEHITPNLEKIKNTMQKLGFGIKEFFKKASKGIAITLLIPFALIWLILEAIGKGAKETYKKAEEIVDYIEKEIKAVDYEEIFKKYSQPSIKRYENFEHIKTFENFKFSYLG